MNRFGFSPGRRVMPETSHEQDADYCREEAAKWAAAADLLTQQGLFKSAEKSLEKGHRWMDIYYVAMACHEAMQAGKK